MQTLFITPISRIQQDLSYDSRCEPKIIVHQANQITWLCLWNVLVHIFECSTCPWSILPSTIDSWCSPGDHSNAAVEDLCLPKGAVLFVFVEHVSVPKHLWAWLNSFIMLPSCQLVRWERVESSFQLGSIVIIILIIHHFRHCACPLSSTTLKNFPHILQIKVGKVYMASFLWGSFPDFILTLYISFFSCAMLALRLYTLLDDTLSEMDKTKVQSDSSRPFRQIWS